MVQPFQQENRDQSCPNLDAQGVFGGAHEALHLEILLERLEKQLDFPAVLVDGGNGGGAKHRTLESIRAIGVDEIQYAKGHKYLTLVYQIDQGITRLLWVGKERTIESFQGFFTVIGDQLASQIQFVCSDMWQPYLDVIRQKCSQALHILDRFHIVAK